MGNLVYIFCGFGNLRVAEVPFFFVNLSDLLGKIPRFTALLPRQAEYRKE